MKLKYFLDKYVLKDYRIFNNGRRLDNLNFDSLPDIYINSIRTYENYLLIYATDVCTVSLLDAICGYAYCVYYNEYGKVEYRGLYSLFPKNMLLSNVKSIYVLDDVLMLDGRIWDEVNR